MAMRDVDIWSVRDACPVHWLIICLCHKTLCSPPREKHANRKWPLANEMFQFASCSSYPSSRPFSAFYLTSHDANCCELELSPGKAIACDPNGMAMVRAPHMDAVWKGERKEGGNRGRTRWTGIYGLFLFQIGD